MPSPTKAFSLRIPPPLKGKLQEMARADRRSLNEIIVWLLERAVADGVDPRPQAVGWVANAAPSPEAPHR